MTAAPLPRLAHPGARLLSLVLCTPLALVLLIHPALMLDASGHYSHGQLMLVMLGIAGGFIHGVGFDPLAWYWRLPFGPWLAWPLLTLGYVLLMNARLD